MKKIFTLLSFVLGSSLAMAQNQYLITFKDKGPEAASLRRHPEKFLSAKSLARRQKSGVFLKEEDLPVSAYYLQQLKLNGIVIRQKSKWLNAVYIETSLEPQALQNQFPEIRTIKEYHAVAAVPVTKFPETIGSNNENRLSYGASELQIGQLNLDCLHDKGYQGKGVLIAVFDTGFPGVNTLSQYDSVRMQNRILATRNFVNKATSVYGVHNHGATVFSVIAANDPGVYVGGAPQATFALAITEYLPTETHQEELNWAAAAEWADSLGADIIQSSLSYKNFDPGQGDYTLAQIDGDTPIITQAADKAAQRGILVVNSAGNDGQFPATGTMNSRVAPPCDGDSVLCVGSVTLQNQYSAFSSVGPTADNRIKPDVVAMGTGTAFVSTSGATGYANGTSLSTPLITSVAACLLQASPAASNMQVYRALIQSADRFMTPNNQVGYGLPDACKADSLLRQITGVSDAVRVAPFKVYPTIFQDQITIEAPLQLEIASLCLYTITGQKVAEKANVAPGKQPFQVAPSLPAGMYVLQVKQQNGTLSQYKLMKR